MIPGQDELSIFRRARLIYMAGVVAAPVIYVIVAQFVRVSVLQPDAGTDMVFYILLVLGAVDPAIYPIIEKAQLRLWRGPKEDRGVPELYLTQTVTKMAFVHTTFIYALVVYLVSGNFERMLWFYPIGALWVFIYWPSEEKYRSFVEKVSRQWT
jgi:hypothetical protein